MTNEEIIAAGVNAHMLLDAALTKAYNQAQRLIDLTEKGAAAGLAKPLKSKRLIHMSRELAGAIATAGRLSADLHIEQTAIAKANGVDTGSLTVVAGVELPSVSVMGGGDR